MIVLVLAVFLLCAFTLAVLAGLMIAAAIRERPTGPAVDACTPIERYTPMTNLPSTPAQVPIHNVPPGKKQEPMHNFPLPHERAALARGLAHYS